MYYFRVTYEAPPATEVKSEEFAEFAAGTTVIEEMLKRQHPTWNILKIERGLKSE
jgi:hypothetical protein